MCSKLTSSSPISAGTILRLGDQQLNDFSVGEANIGEKQSRQLNSKYTIKVHYAVCIFRKKGMCGVQWSLPQKLGNFREFLVLKVTLQSVRLLLTVSYRKKIGGTRMYYTCSPNNFVRGSSPQFPRKNQSMDVNVYTDHWRQPRRGCRGHIPINILVGGDVNGIPHQYYYVLSDIADKSSSANDSI